MPNLQPLTRSAKSAAILGVGAGGVVGAADALVNPRNRQVSRGVSRLTATLGIGAPIAAGIAMHGDVIGRSQAYGLAGAGLGLAGAFVVSNALSGSVLTTLTDGTGLTDGLGNRLRQPLPA